MKLKLTEEFTHKLTTLQKEIIEHINQVTNRDEEPGPLDIALAGKSRNRNIECEKDRKKVRGAERKLTDVNSLEEPDDEPRAPSPLTLALAGITKENESVNVDVPDPVEEEQTENSEIESDESDSEIDISNIRYAIYSESGESE